MTERDTLLSPRLTALREALASGDASALTPFWHEMAV